MKGIGTHLSLAGEESSSVSRGSGVVPLRDYFCSTDTHSPLAPERNMSIISVILNNFIQCNILELSIHTHINTYIHKHTFSPNANQDQICENKDFLLW